MAKDLFGNEIPEKGPSGNWSIGGKRVNPMVYGYGPGPEGKKCKHCAHLGVKRMGNTYYKCTLRHNTNGPATDHRVNWPACSKFKEDE